MILSSKKMCNRFGAIFLSTVLVFSSCAMTVPVFGAEAGSDAGTVVFDNTGDGEDMISLTEPRSFTAKVKVDLSKDELEKAISDGSVKWTLSRDKGIKDADKFPNQYMGGPLENWTTIATEVQEETEMFKSIKNIVVEENGTIYLQLSFENRTVLGYEYASYSEANWIMDYTGEFTLSCTIGEKEVGSTSVWVRPYDGFYTQEEGDQKLVELAARANAAGLYAKVEQFGTSTAGYPMNAIFIAASASDLTDHLALAERAETEPAKVQEEVKAGTLKYKVPVMYSNIHSNEIMGPDACFAFIEALVEAAEGNGKIPYTKITGLTETGKATVKAEMEQDGKVWSELIKDKVTGVGYIQGDGKFEATDPNHSSDATVDLTDEEMAKYYNMKDTELNVKDVLDDVFFIIVPSENADARTDMTRTNSNKFDLNRDNKMCIRDSNTVREQRE